MMTKMKLLKCLPWLVMLCGLGGNALADGLGEPIPSYYEEPGISKTRDYISQHDAEHIDPFTGKLQYHFVDAFIPGNGGLDLKVQRSYNSVNDTFTVTPANIEETAVGLGWTMHFGRVLKRATALLCDNINIPSKNAVLEMADGSRRVLYLALDGVTWITTDFWKAECKLTAPQGLNVYSPDGTRYEMTSTGHSFGPPLNVQNVTNVGRIVDRNGNWLSFTYVYLANGISAVKTVTSSDGRAVIFNYSGSTLTTVTDSANTITYASYIYGTGSGYSLLTKMTRSDGQTWDFAYNTAYPGGNSLRQIMHPTGGVIDYTYGYVQFGIGPSIPQSTVVIQKVATRTDTVSGQVGAPIIDTWTYLYKPATELLPVNYDAVTDTTSTSWSCDSSLASNAKLDTTTVTGPDQVRVYGNVGFNSVSPGFVAYIGSKACIDHANQIELFGYNWITISNQVNVRPGNTLAFDNSVGALLPKYQFTGRFGESFTTSLSNFDTFGNPGTITETGNSTKITNVTYNNIPSKWIIRQNKDKVVTEGTESIATTRTFDANGNMLTEVNAGVPTTYAYHSTGDLSSKTDARSKMTQYSNYYRGIPRLEQQPAGITQPLEPTETVLVTRLVSDSGNITSETDAEGATTSFSYDGLNRVTGITHPLGNPVSVAWGANSRTVTRGPYIAETTFDGFGREVRVVHTDTNSYPNVGTNIPIVQNYKVDSLGRRTFVSYPNSTMGTKKSYDLLNRPTFIYNEYLPAMNGNSDSWASSRRYSYFNFETQLVDERNVVHTMANRYYGNPDKGDVMASTTSATTGVIYLGNVTIPQTVSTTTQITRNIIGQKTSVTLDGVTRNYGYNNNFFLTSNTEPETGITLMGRDAVGNLISRKVGTSTTSPTAGSGITTFTYDDRNRLATVTYPKSVPASLKDATDVIKRYYKDDKLKSVDNGISKHEYLYDTNKNMTTETLTMGAKFFPTTYSYNGNDANASIKYGSLKTVTYEPDAFGRPRQAMPYVSAIAYHPSGQPSSYTYANGITSTIGLNGRQWPSALRIANPGNSALFNTSYNYDKAGNIASISDMVDSSFSRVLGYDFLDRLIVANGPWGNGSIEYDTQSNIINQNFGTNNLNYLYNRNVSGTLGTQRLVTTSGSKAYALQYDLYGNVINNGISTFTYNDAAQLKCANCGLASEVLYDYDGNNQRVKSVKAGVATYFVYGQGGELLWEETPGAIPNVTPNGTRKEYIYLGGKQIATREEVLP